MIAWVLRGLAGVFCLIASGAAWWTWNATGSLGWTAAALLATLAAATTGMIALEFALSFIANRILAVGVNEQARDLMTWRQSWQAFVGELLISGKVFMLWQPWFGSRTLVSLPAASQGRRGVVYVHGYFCNSAFWREHCRAARADGVPHIALTLEPAFGEIDDYAAPIHAAVLQLQAATGLPPLLVGHSMGGLAARAYVASYGAAAVQRIVTIGTPHHGTWHARHGVGINGRHMRLDSPWLKANAVIVAAPLRSQFVCFFSNGDNIVAPIEAAMLSGADNRFIAATGHVKLAFTDEVKAEIAKSLAQRA